MREEFRQHHLNLYRYASHVIGPALCDQPRTIVDCACGLGHGYEFLSPLGRYVGLDRSYGALETARERYPEGEFRYAEFSHRSMFRGIRPDAVVSIETAEHLDDPASFLRRIALALPAGGRLVFSAPTSRTRDFDPYHVNDFTADEWGELLAWAGFTVEGSRAFTIEGSFRDFLHTIPTTFWQRARVALFDLCHPAYAIDRLWNWTIKGRFEWTSTLYVCSRAPIRHEMSKQEVATAPLSRL